VTIYLRSVLEENGDTVDLSWYCSRTCYVQSLEAEPPSDQLEEGGAYPCGAEADSPDFCATCGEPVGNPITPEGESRVREWLQDLPFRLDPTGTLAARADSLRRTYSYL
jgi:hypothetical protein